MANKRFISEKNKTEGASLSDTRIITDTETGVQYLFVTMGGYAGGLTLLVDAEGKPLLNKTYNRYRDLKDL